MEKLRDVILLHDGDIFAYRASAATDGRQYAVTWDAKDENVYTEYYKYKKDADLKAAEIGPTASVNLSYVPEPESHALHIVKETIRQVQVDLRPYVHNYLESGEFYLTNKGSFREKLVPTYKMNRADLRRPEHLFSCKQFIINKYDGICRTGEYEADDMLAMRMTACQAEGFNPICVSIDKDLKQVSGWHWDFVKKELVYISPVEGHRNFYKQLLTGDTTDGIVGIKGIGPKTAEKLIDHLSSPFDMYVVCLKEWLKFLKQEADEDPIAYMERVVHHVNLNARLLYLLRSYDDVWEEPNEEVSTAAVTV